MAPWCCSRVMHVVWVLALLFFNVASPACSQAASGMMFSEHLIVVSAAPLEGGSPPAVFRRIGDAEAPIGAPDGAPPVPSVSPAAGPFPAGAPPPTAGTDSPSPAPARVAPPPALLSSPAPVPAHSPSPDGLAGSGIPPAEDRGPVSGPFTPASGRSSSILLVAILAGGGSGVFIIAALVVAVMCRISRRNRAASVLPWKVGMSGPMQKPFVTAIPAISRAEVEVACEDFSNIIGSSPDSVVFKGTLEDGTEIAATSIRMSAECWTSKSEIFFRLKIESLARMNHTHLVNLVSYCAEDDPFARMLIFEYASNGTLYEHLHLKETEHLSWPIRMRIVMGAAYGLRYLHHELVPPVSHQNLDTSAVYLTDDYAAKLAEFGVSKGAVVKSDRRRSRSGSALGIALDYDDSEGSDRHAPDFEGNVYAFGVLLLEVVTGRRPHSEKEGSLVDWATTYINNSEKLHFVADSSLESFDRSQLVSVCQVSRLCTNTDPQKRPSMKEATAMLETALKITPEIAAPKGSLLWAELEILASS